MSKLHQLLSELESHQLQVILVPLNPNRRGWNEYGMKRVCLDKSPRWYSQLCSRHTSSRGVRRGKHDTRIRRATILNVLRRLCAGRRSWSRYAPELLEMAGRVG